MSVPTESEVLYSNPTSVCCMSLFYIAHQQLYSISFKCSATLNLAAVFSLISSTVTPGASSVNSMPPLTLSTWKTHCPNRQHLPPPVTTNRVLTRSVMMVLTTLAPVRGRLHSSMIFGDPSFATWSVVTMILVASGFDTRSIAPPIPFKTLPGII